MYLNLFYQLLLNQLYLHMQIINYYRLLQLLNL